jgi:hypothetical protein
MTLKRRLRGSQYRFLRFTEESLTHVATITFKAGEPAPDGTLYGIATRVGGVLGSGGSGDEVELTVTDITAGGPVTIEAILDPADFAIEGEPSVWQFEIGFSDPDAFNGVAVDWQVLVGGIWYRTAEDVYLEKVLIASTTIEEEGSS